MRGRLSRMRSVAVALGVVALLAAGTTTATSSPKPTGPAAPGDGQITPDITKLVYAPEGHFKAGDPIPSPLDFETALQPHMDGLRFNPSGTYNAYDTNIFEVIGLPYRGAGDIAGDDPYGNGGDPRHGYCGEGLVDDHVAPDPSAPDPTHLHVGGVDTVAGECPNHQIEYSHYFAETMQEILGDFGVTIQRHRFFNPGGSNTASGMAINTAAIVPGADHPEETVIISGHFDQTKDGPASAWDSAEGHAQVIRVAKLMADYWRETGTRPSATVKFVPWDAEESGTLGSLDYARNNVVPGEEHKVRGYFNTDPCAGGYPAFRFGNPADRVQLGIQLANPDRLDDLVTFESENPPEEARARIEAFNAMAPRIVDEVFDHLDDTLTVGGSEREIFVSSREAAEQGTEPDLGNDVVIGSSRAILFSSDWRNFEDLGIPFFNPGPEITGPSSQGEPGNPDGLAILHTPNDNLQTLNAYTGGDPSGLLVSDGWQKGMEMCSHLLAWFMLQPEMAGARLVNPDVVGYFEALPNESRPGVPVRFDASGSHQVRPSAAKGKGPKGALVTGDDLAYQWDFGDGASGTGRWVEHAYGEPGVYQATLTVRRGDRFDTMSIPITVTADALLKTFPGPSDIGVGDGGDLQWSPVGGDPDGYQVEHAADGALAFDDDAESPLEERWDASIGGADDPFLAGWQQTGPTTPAPAGNRFHSPSSSFWTGRVPPKPPQTIRSDETRISESVLTLRDPIRIPAGGQAALSYWSLYRNDLTDVGTVEVAIADAGGGNEWVPVDEIRGDDYVSFLPGLDAVFGGGVARIEELVHRSVDLSAFAGHDVLIRFRAAFTHRHGVFIQRNGWYVDDIRVETGTFAPVAQVTGTSYPLAGAPAGAYQVRALYDDGTATLASPIRYVE
jgi:hypothetical protein